MYSKLKNFSLFIAAMGLFVLANILESKFEDNQVIINQPNLFQTPLFSSNWI